MKCRFHNGSECTNTFALPLYGARPSKGVCKICDHYKGPVRGLGDVIHNVARLTGLEKLTKISGKPCNCAARRKSLNERFPSGDLKTP